MKFLPLPALRLRHRLLLLFLLAVVPIYSFLMFSANRNLNRISAQSGREALHQARDLLASARAELPQPRKLLDAIARHPALHHGDTQACHTALTGFSKDLPEVVSIGILTRHGRLRCGTADGSAFSDASDRVHFRRALISREFSLGNVREDPVTGSSRISFALPLLDTAGQVYEVIVLTLDLSWLEYTFNPVGTVVSVIDASGRIVWQAPAAKELIGRQVPDASAWESIAARQAEGESTSVWFDGSRHVNAYLPLFTSSSDSLYLRVGIPANAARQSARDDFVRDTAILAVMTLLIFIGLSKGGDRLVLRPVEALTRTARQFAQGDLTARTQLSDRDDEFGLLAKSFDAIAEDLQGVTRALRTLGASNQALLRAEDEKSLLTHMCKVAVKNGGYKIAWVGYAMDDAQKSVQPMAHTGNDDGALTKVRVSWGDNPEGQGIVGTAIRTGQPQIEQGIQSNPRFVPWRKFLRKLELGSACSLPLIIDGRPLGAITFYAAEADAFQQAEMAPLKELADDLAFGIRTLRQRIAHRAAEETIRRLAHFDAHTGLSNRVKMATEMRQLMATGGDQPRKFALLLVEVDSFSDIQDALGQSGGDQLLLEIARRLRQLAQPDWLIGRISGNRFGVLVPEANDPIDVARSVLQLFESQFQLAGIMVDVRASVGISLFPEHGDDADALIRRAIIAARDSIHSGTEIMLYAGATERENPERLALIADLRRAIDHNEFLLQYQPKVDIHTRSVTGAEALVRWQHPQRGLIPPNKFIGLAEQTGLIKPLTEWVLNEAMRQSSQWQQSGLHIPVAVNLSARNLRDPLLPDKLYQRLAAWKLDPALLHIEITESVIMEDHSISHGILTRLKEMGTRIYLDDFGTGYSSLGYLGNLPAHALKIDRSFVLDILDKPQMRTLVASIVTLGHNLGLSIVAEGVERQEELDLLTTLGCDEIQGYFFSRPLPPDDFVQWCRAFASEAVASDA